MPSESLARESSLWSGKKNGRKRKGRSMGRYPFLTWKSRYLGSMGSVYAKATTIELDRRYRRMDRAFRVLREQGKVSTINPEKLTAEDILAFVGFMKESGLKESGILHELSPLKSLLDYIGNPAMAEYKRRFRSTLPKRRTARLPPMDEEVFRTILQEADRVPEDDWRKLEAYAVVVLGLCTGMRNKELRLCDVDDIDLSRKVIVAQHVKGEGSYGQSREIAMRPEAIGIMRKYLRARRKQVMQNCLCNEALFPALMDKGDGYLSSNSLIELKAIVEAEIGSRSTSGCVVGRMDRWPSMKGYPPTPSPCSWGTKLPRPQRLTTPESDRKSPSGMLRIYGNRLRAFRVQEPRKLSSKMR